MAARDLYATESVLYQTLGIIDQFENPKVDVETAIAAILANKTLSSVVELALSFPATSFLAESSPMSEEIRNCLQLQFRGESLDDLEEYVGTVGIEYCRVSAISPDRTKQSILLIHELFQQAIKGNRVKSFNDSIMDKILSAPKVLCSKASMDLDEHVHPSLKESADELDSSIRRLFAGTSILLYRYKGSAGQKLDEVKKLGEAAVLCYAIYSSLGRGSRSYCIGLRHCVYETVMSDAITEDYSNRVLDLMMSIKQGPNGDEDFRAIAAKAIEMKGKVQFPPIVKSKKAE